MTALLCTGFASKIYCFFSVKVLSEMILKLFFPIFEAQEKTCCVLFHFSAIRRGKTLGCAMCNYICKSSILELTVVLT